MAGLLRVLLHLAELVERVLRELEAVVGHVLEHLERPAGPRQRHRQAAGELDEFLRAAAGVLQLADRAEVLLDPSAHHGLGRRPHVELRVQRARHAFHHDHGLLQQHQLGARLHVEEAGDLEQQRQQARHRDLVGGARVDRLADGADRLRKILDAVHVRHVARLEMHLGDALIVARDEAVEDLGEEAPLLEPEAAHDPEIDRDEAPLAIDEQVALMHVGVKQAVAHRVAQEALDDDGAELRQHEALLRQPDRVVELGAVDPFERQHLGGGSVPIDLRHAEVGLAGHVLRELGGGGGLQPEIGLHLERAGERVDDARRTQALAVGKLALDEGGGGLHVGEVALHQPLDAGASHLDRHVALAERVADAAAVHLRDGGGGDGLAERHEEVVEPAAEGLLDLPHRLLARERVHAVLQPLQRLDDVGPDDVGPRRQELAELHVGWAQLRDCGRQGGERGLLRLAADQPRERQRQLGGGRQQRRVDIVEDAGAGQHEAGARQAEERPQAEDHARAFLATWRLTASSPNGWRRCRPTAAPPASAGSRRRAAGPRRRRRRGIGGSTRRDSGRTRRRPSPSRRATG